MDFTHGLLEGEAGVAVGGEAAVGDVDKVDRAGAAVAAAQEVDLAHAQRAVAVVQHADAPRRRRTCTCRRCLNHLMLDISTAGA